MKIEQLLTNLVDAEPFVGRTDQARQVSLDIFDVVELACKRVLDVNDDDLPVCLALVEKSHDTENLDLLELPNVSDLLADLADIERVVVTLCLGFGVDLVGVFPSLIETLANKHDKMRRVVLEGTRRSSRCTHGGGSSYGRNEVCPFLCPA